MGIQVLLDEGCGVLLSREVPVELEGEDVAVAHLGSALLLFDYLLLDIGLEEIEETWRHLKFQVLSAHELRDEVVVASLVKELQLGYLVGLVVESVVLEDDQEALGLGEANL